VHGRIIEVDDDLGIVDGQEVEIELRIMGPKKKKKLPGPPPGWKPGAESMTSGLLADPWTDEDDRILEESRVSLGCWLLKMSSWSA
jgi:hypothetical protein